MLADVLNRLSIAAFLLDECGTVLMGTFTANDCPHGNEILGVRAGKLVAKANQTELEEVLRRAIGDDRREGVPAKLTMHASGQDVIVRIWPLSQQTRIPFGLAAILVIETVDDSVRVHAADVSRFGLTSAEMEIANMLLSGERVESIAQRRHTSLSTVRAQIRSVYFKTGIHRRAELLTLLRAVAPQQGHVRTYDPNEAGKSRL